MRIPANIKDFYIAVGEPGTWHDDMEFNAANIIRMANDFGFIIKHSMYNVMGSAKNIISQTWPDEDGDDVFLPYTIDANGNKVPAIRSNIIEYNPTFVFNQERFDGENLLNSQLQIFKERVLGRWLCIYDSYTGIGYKGAYLVDFGEDAKFKRRSKDYCEFTLKFKVNGIKITDLSNIITQ